MASVVISLTVISLNSFLLDSSMNESMMNLRVRKTRGSVFTSVILLSPFFLNTFADMLDKRRFQTSIGFSPITYDLQFNCKANQTSLRNEKNTIQLIGRNGKWLKSVFLQEVLAILE